MIGTIRDGQVCTNHPRGKCIVPSSNNLNQKREYNMQIISYLSMIDCGRRVRSSLELLQPIFLQFFPLILVLPAIFAHATFLPAILFALLLTPEPTRALLRTDSSFSICPSSLGVRAPVVGCIVVLFRNQHQMQQGSVGRRRRCLPSIHSTNN